LLVAFAGLKPRNRAEFAEPLQQVCQTWAILLAHRREFQPQSTTGLYLAHNSFRPDLSFFDKKMKVCLCANGLELPRLDE